MMAGHRDTAGGPHIREERAQDFGIAIDKLGDRLAVEPKDPTDTVTVNLRCTARQVAGLWTD